MTAQQSDLVAPDRTLQSTQTGLAITWCPAKHCVSIVRKLLANSQSTLAKNSRSRRRGHLPYELCLLLRSQPAGLHGGRTPLRRSAHDVAMAVREQNATPEVQKVSESPSDGFRTQSDGYA